MTYSDLQRNFLLGISVNQRQGAKGTDLSLQMAPCIHQALQVLDLSDWKVIWGPAIFQNTPGGVFDNAAFVAFNAELSTYFVAVAGTNPASAYDWMEDLDTGNTVPWPYDPNGSRIAQGNFRGITQVMNMTPMSQLPGVGQTMTAFLTENLASRPGPCTLITGGHSLGGALSPLIALSLTDTQETWNPDGKITAISCYASAGPTPGLADFAAYYNTRVPDTHRIHNTLDVVPHAWNADDLAAVPRLYCKPRGPQKESPAVYAFAQIELKKVAGLDYEQQGLTDVPLEGTYHDVPATETFKQFTQEMYYQHIEAYFHLLGLSDQYTAFRQVCP